MIYYLYPFLLCLIPVHALFGQNIGEISLKNYFQTIAYFCVSILLIIFILNYLIKDILTTEIIFCINYFLLLYANSIYLAIFSKYKASLSKNKICFILLYLFCCLTITFFIISFAEHLFLPIVAKILFWLSFIINILIVADIIQKCLNYFDKNVLAGTEIPAALPDIYHILADGHSGFSHPRYSDVYFKTELEKKGFYICQNAHSNYNQTHLSVPSMLNMDYIYNLIPDSQYVCAPYESWHLYSNNIVFNTLKRYGYKFSLIMNKMFINIHKNYSGADFIYSYGQNHNDLFDILIFNSIFRFFYKKNFKDSLERDVNDLLEEYTRQLKKNTKRPRYIYMHLLAPHNPYFTDEHGNKIRGDIYHNHKLYGAYQKYIDKQLLKLIDEIQKNMKENSIIIIHSDHCLHEEKSIKDSFNILLALYCSDKNRFRNIPDNCTLVNLFRYLFNELYGKQYPILKNKYYEISLSTNAIKENLEIGE